MMQNETTNKIQQEREKTFGLPTELEIISTAQVNKGILVLKEEEKISLIQRYEKSSLSSGFFIPSSGSGSRMFGFMHKFIVEPNDENQGQIERLLHHIQRFAFYKKIDGEILNALNTNSITLEQFVDYLLNENGLNLSNLPKGLVPFHKIGPFVLTPFQEHLLQGNEVIPAHSKFHFTINEDFQKRIREEQENLRNFITSEIEVTYSYQDTKSNTLVFDKNQELVFDKKGNPLTRPSGHGALLGNLSKVNSDIIFIKNIDNIQHYNQSQTSIDTFKILGGLLLELENDRNQLVQNFSKVDLLQFNTRYQIFLEEEITNATEEQLLQWIDLPMRVCGMVKNEGEPGGGPFWVKKDQITRKQIVEKSQIPAKFKNNVLLLNSTHFNPVMIALRNANSNGIPFKLEEYTDESQYINVKKDLNGQDVYFTEKPGLWNGSMYNWLTVFVEIPSEVFSPVKTVLDLLSPIHQEK